ncbi:carbon-nitrogen hydrolase family protein [Paenarthrobacter aurescens]|uniref:Carbon-nitrogen hydrolase family protein n=1 Tax=Paenarthrobacter aurescens TaxID=43663 RepID=A0A4Y3NLZ1_PAEAU|nr:carbon-nitrogen hydrolase family protein [Paenarthrobacter aurescens]UKA51346.1 carbon-nitrogen hydrolase family protein [Arthrobacter sp. FW305-123]MDO6143101.1 carbon-nitrogen hydrolase family protein [Paenarthrobacter aurescens]MDO6146946.1 carbon-nitrogen hydrolase family protein [Paenarthrobacter aurescens]MDO6158192.1 carbon-nitrogen hydrolase family protein [Paenarthrobacter aurescens]MDO6162177.1 carbon-nitrogen hydrolase family protein [Paenarthrobacter aurescens]
MTHAPSAAERGPSSLRGGREPEPSTALRVALVQYRPHRAERPGEAVVANVQTHARLVERAHAEGARLVLFPELSLTGYELEGFGLDESRPGSDEGPGPWTSENDERLRPLQESCSSTGTTAVVGAGWRDVDSTPRLASLVVGPDGSLRAVFKTHLHGLERQLFVPGTGPGILTVDGWRIALAVCADAAHPAHAAAAAQEKADVYAVSALYVRGEEMRLGLHMGARSMDHRMFGLMANLGGETALGASCGLTGVWNPSGAVVAQAAGSGPAAVMATLERSSLDQYRLEDQYRLDTGE